ncbi:hypothetical protein ABIA32_005433 [Streptacidiphilus sp. MAP12-20]|uniref:hypothetical protein n=1 Tax=Streptacidiphilus sp. MAP12-20 TaxID=3156299 RepID=UPI00351931DB
MNATPAEDLAGYLRDYPTEAVFGEEPAELAFDRYHVPAFEQLNDGILLDRERLIAHTGPARKNVTALTLDIHDTLVQGNHVAARYTLRTTMRKGPVLVSTIWMFGELAPDGRLRRIVSTSRTEPVQEPATAQAAADRITPSTAG